MSKAFADHDRGVARLQYGLRALLVQHDAGGAEVDEVFVSALAEASLVAGIDERQYLSALQAIIGALQVEADGCIASIAKADALKERDL